MPHFVPEIIFGSWVEVTGPTGTEWIEAGLVGQIEAYPGPGPSEAGEDSKQERSLIPIPEPLATYCQNTTAWEIKVVERWGARQTAPGYLDCTAWTVFESEEEARAYLDDEQAQD